MQRLVIFVSMSAILVSGCNDRRCYWGKSDKEVLKEYAGSNLPNLYDAHLFLSSNCTPPRVTLAASVAEFGPSVRSYAISRIDDTPGSFEAASSTIAQVNANTNERCSADELDRFRRAAIGLKVDPKVKRLYVEGVDQACS